MEPIIMGVLGAVAVLSAIGLVLFIWLYIKGFWDKKKKDTVKDIQNGKY
ncbi:MAG: hypothetical protein M0P71_12830 [Melioribacteraceae bacterium]|jgi:hypothetical protein|nr:hypothetical protein [Melioribacteraceae bacterium]